jgi:hypothetical protein
MAEEVVAAARTWLAVMVVAAEKFETVISRCYPERLITSVSREATLRVIRSSQSLEDQRLSQRAERVARQHLLLELEVSSIQAALEAEVQASGKLEMAGVETDFTAEDIPRVLEEAVALQAVLTADPVGAEVATQEVAMERLLLEASFRAAQVRAVVALAGESSTSVREAEEELPAVSTDRGQEADHQADGGMGLQAEQS